MEWKVEIRSSVVPTAHGKREVLPWPIGPLKKPAPEKKSRGEIHGTHLEPND